MDRIIDFFTIPQEEWRSYLFGLISATLVALLTRLLQKRSQRRKDREFFKVHENAGLKSGLVTHYYCYYINPINKTFVRAPLVLTKLKVKSKYFDQYYKADYYSCDSSGEEKKYFGKGSLKGNILEVTLYDKEKGEVLFLLAHKKNNRASAVFNALHLCTDSRDEVVSSNRVIEEIKVNSQKIRLEAQELSAKAINRNVDLIKIHNYLTYEAKRIRLEQFMDKSIDGLTVRAQKKINDLNIIHLQKIVGVWVSFSKVYKEDEIRSFRWAITQDEKNFEVKREGGEGLFKGTVKVGNEFISFVLAQASLDGKFIDLVPTGKRKHILALTENRYDLYFGLTTTFVTEDSKIKPVVTREIMIKLSSDPGDVALAEGHHKNTPSLEEIEQILLTRNFGEKPKKIENKAKELTQTVENYLNIGNGKIYPSLELDTSEVKKEDQFHGQYYVYFINELNDQLERFFIRVDMDKIIEGKLARQIGEKEWVEDLYTGKVSFEREQMVIIQVAGNRPVSITFKRLKVPIGYLSTYDENYVPISVKVRFEKCTSASPVLVDWNKKSKKHIEDYLRSDNINDL